MLTLKPLHFLLRTRAVLTALPSAFQARSVSESSDLLETVAVGRMPFAKNRSEMEFDIYITLLLIN